MAATGVHHMCAFNYRFVPAVRLAREMVEAGELGEVRHFRGRYLQDWGDDPSLDTWRFDADAGRLRRPRRPVTHVVDLARFLIGEIETVSGFVHTFVPGGGRRRGRGRGRVRERIGRDDRGDPARARPPQRVPVGDQRLEGLARLRHGAAERAPGLPRRRRPCARLQDGARLRGGPSVLEHWWPPGHIVGWGDTFVHELHHFLSGGRGRARRRAVRRRRSRTATAPRRSATRSSAPARAARRETSIQDALSQSARDAAIDASLTEPSSNERPSDRQPCEPQREPPSRSERGEGRLRRASGARARAPRPTRARGSSR